MAKSAAARRTARGEATRGEAAEVWLADGYRKHLAGQWAAAETLYRRVLARRPALVRAQFLLGSVLAQRGQHAEAALWLGRVLKAEPEHAPALSHRGVALKELGRMDEALAHYTKALAVRPDYPEALNNRGAAYQAQRRWEEAAADHEAALALRPEYAEALTNLGLCRRALERWGQAEEVFRQVYALQPGNADAANNLGLALLARSDFAGALALFEAATAADPQCMVAFSNSSIALKELGRVPEAKQVLARVLAALPEYAEAHVNLGTCLMAENSMHEALASTDMALALAPEHAGAHWNRALILLTQGDEARGWPEYEWRWKCQVVAGRTWDTPRWQGEPLAGRTLLVHAEQGLGDTVQFVRLCAAVPRTDGGRVVLECPPALHALLADCAGIDQIVEVPPAGEAPAAHDVHISLLSLPGVLGTAADACCEPYLRAPAERDRRWRAALGTASEENTTEEGASETKLKVGIVWAGNPGHKNDRNRSCRLQDFAALSAVPGAEFYSLQKGPAEADLDAPGAWRPVPLGALLTDFADTAAVLMQMDLLVAVDTSTAHVAGALGRPVWTLLPFTPDWRWRLGTEETPWYPSMRLFRQGAAGDWGEVLARVARELSAYAQEHARLPQTLQAWEAQPPPDLQARLQELSRRFAGTARVWNDLGVCCWQDGAAGDALRAMLRALREGPADPVVRLNCADVLAAFGRVEEAAMLRADCGGAAPMGG